MPYTICINRAKISNIGNTVPADCELVLAGGDIIETFEIIVDLLDFNLCRGVESRPGKSDSAHEGARFA